MQIEILIFRTKTGKEPFSDWIRDLRNLTAKQKIFARMDRLTQGVFGDFKAVGEGVFELRFANGIRIYFGRVGNQIVLLLFGGDKSSQKKDIAKAKEYWEEYHEQKN
jgi:putative addiction module killer protein